MFPLPVIQGRQKGGLQLAPELVENKGQDEESPGIGEIVQKSEHVNIYDYFYSTEMWIRITMMRIRILIFI